MDIILIPALVSTLIAWQNPAGNSTQLITPISHVIKENITLSSRTYSLTNRHQDKFVNDVFTDNILLTLTYMAGTIKKDEPIAWDKIHAPAKFTFTLKPTQTFAFHDKVFEKYASSLAVTTNAHFNSAEGFRSDGWLVGDGVCHLASFIKVVAQDAGLSVEAPRDHSFAPIPEVETKDGVAIFYSPVSDVKSNLENLYITNSRDKTVIFVFTHQDNLLTVQVEEVQL